MSLSTVRGGLESSRSYRILADGVRFSVYADRFRSGAGGLSGGKAGVLGFCHVYRGNEVIDVRSKADMTLHKGDLVVLGSGGGGGHGDPALRSSVAADADAAQGDV